MVIVRISKSGEVVIDLNDTHRKMGTQWRRQCRHRSEWQTCKTRRRRRPLRLLRGPRPKRFARMAVVYDFPPARAAEVCNVRLLNTKHSVRELFAGGVLPLVSR